MRDFNFFSASLTKKRASINKYKIAATVAVGLTVFIAGTSGWNYYKINKMENEINEMNKYLTAPTTIAASKKVEELKKQIESRNKQLTELDALLNEIGKRDAVSINLLEKITAVIPQAVSFKSIGIKAGSIQIECMAKGRVSVAELEHNLKNVEGFKDVSIPAVNTAENGEDTTFSISCAVKEEASNENK